MTTKTAKEVMQRGLYAGLGCTTVDFRSPLKVDAAAAQLADFAISALEEDGFKIIPPKSVRGG